MALRRKSLIVTIAAMLALGFAGDALARAGSGSSFGSRGARTFSMPKSTPVAPRGAAPMERSYTSPNEGIFGRSAPASQGGFFSGAFSRGLLGGFLGAGLFGLLFGHGLFGGLGGGLSILGLLLQIGILFLLFKLVMGFLRGRKPAFAGAGFDRRPGEGSNNPQFSAREGLRGFGGGQAAPLPETKFEPVQADFTTFEKRLAEIQSAYSGEDMERLRAIATPEMVSYFAEEFAANAGNGVVNKVSEVKFLKGDLSEAWREPQEEYATVAMRYSLIDTMANRITGKIVAGDPAAPQEVTEVWTFIRPIGSGPGGWKLSAIQQA
ncbi:MAG: TIM44-like domain-containing protein [Beijerinckiaceae bacterium]|nr:TIM44-like domain-containing protein [Beijerinckiaceae bacterium]